MAKWKPVPIEVDGVLDNIEGLVGIEVLDESDNPQGVTHVIRGKRKEKRKSKKTKKKEKKAPAPAEISSDDNDDNGEVSDSEEATVPEVKLTKSKKLQSANLEAEPSVTNGKKAKKRKATPQKKESTKQKDIIKNAKKLSLQKQNLDKDDKDYLKDMKQWAKHGLRPEILKALHDKGFYSPTKIQQCCIHAAITSEKSDIVGAAETGSGKTYAYGIPIVQNIITENEKAKADEATEKGDRLAAIIVAPTRELAVQVVEHLTLLCKYTDINVALVVGGLAKAKQERLLKRKPEIVVGTPGRLWELFSEGNPHLNAIPRVRMLVVDEADRMLEQKHFAELGELLERMNADAEFRDYRRNFVFSATLTFVHDPPSYHTGKRKKPKQKLGELLGKIGVKNQVVYDLSAEKMTPATLSEWKIQCQFSEKDYHLVYFLQRNPGRAIIFCNSIGCVKRLANLLTILKFKPLPLHANMEQKQRLRNLEKFRDSTDGLLLATDVAARGLDIPQVGHVVHYQVPRTAESYVHRSGRTARQSQSGATLLIVSVEDTRLYNKLMKSLKRVTGVENLDIALEELNQVKKLVHLARDIDQAGLVLRRTTTSEKWYEKAMEEMDIVLDEDEMPEKTSDHAMKKLKKELSMKEKELDRLLAAPTMPRGFSAKFPGLNVSQPAKKKRRVS